MISRRKALSLLARTSGAVIAAPRILAAESPARPTRLGIGMHSYGFHWQAARDKSSLARFSDALDFLEYCHRLGAGGVQATIKSKDIEYARQIRAKAEAYGIYFEGQLSLPKE